MTMPNFFIVGAPKCGTTALYSYLKQHPEVFLSEMKEPHFFGSDLSFQNRMSPEAYRELFAGAADRPRVGEASASYLYSARAASEIHQLDPAARIIVMLRNPVDMLYSLHSEYLSNGLEELPDFQVALDAEESRKRGERLPASLTWRSVMFCKEFLFYREVARIAQQVARYVDVFTPKNVHVILFDDFKRDTSAVYRETLGFLGIRQDFQPNFEVVNPNKTVRSRWLRTFLSNPPRVVQHLARWLLPQRLKLHLYEGLRDMNLRRESRPPLDAALRRRLQEEFRPEVERLGSLLGRDLLGWCAN
jgi:Sulfotransferase domain